VVDAAVGPPAAFAAHASTHQIAAKNDLELIRNVKRNNGVMSVKDVREPRAHRHHAVQQGAHPGTDQEGQERVHNESPAIDLYDHGAVETRQPWPGDQETDRGQQHVWPYGDIPAPLKRADEALAFISANWMKFAWEEAPWIHTAGATGVTATQGRLSTVPACPFKGFIIPLSGVWQNDRG
jgi:hypothetical protein